MVDIVDYLNKLIEAHKEEFRTLYPNLTPPTFQAHAGRKYTKVLRIGTSKTVHCFIENATGDIYKAANWKAPAKHVRGNINDVNPPLMGKDYYIRY